VSYRRQRRKLGVYAVQVVTPRGRIVTWISPQSVEQLALDWSDDPSKDDFRFIGIDKSGYEVGGWSISEVLAGWYSKDIGGK